MVNAGADRFWEIMARDFVDISKWARGVKTSRSNPDATKVPKGAPTGGRICEVDGLGELDERIVHFDSVKREITRTASADKETTTHRYLS